MHILLSISNEIADNVAELLSRRDNHSPVGKPDALQNTTGVGEQAVYAWLNHDRENVRMPFIQLCRIADALHADIWELLSGDKCKYELHFAVIRIIGNDEYVLKVFGANEKGAAMACDDELAKTNDVGILACVFAPINSVGQMKRGRYCLYRVWETQVHSLSPLTVPWLALP